MLDRQPDHLRFKFGERANIAALVQSAQKAEMFAFSARPRSASQNAEVTALAGCDDFRFGRNDRRPNCGCDAVARWTNNSTAGLRARVDRERAGCPEPPAGRSGATSGATGK